ncbi:MAG: hypothetical protein ACPL28_10670 [bacterium]
MPANSFSVASNFRGDTCPVLLYRNLKNSYTKIMKFFIIEKIGQDTSGLGGMLKVVHNLKAKAITGVSGGIP